MPKLSYSLVIAFGIHLALFGVSAFFVEKKPTTIFLDSKNAIDVHLGAKSNSKASLLKKKLSALSVSTGTNANTSALPETLGGMVNERNSNTEPGEFAFEGSSLNYTEPVYPKLAIKRGLQGNVRMRIKVSLEGLPIGVEILQSSGHESLDRSAKESVSSWRFQKRDTIYFVEKNVLFQLKN